MTIALSAVILHRMDHTQGVLDRSNDLTAVAGAAQRTLQAQIATNMGDSRAQRHTFDAATARVVDGATAQILAAPNDARVFIAETRTIAQRLYDSLVPNVSVGDLLAGLFTIDDGPPWLALLKMQPEKGYVQQVHGSADAADRRFEIDETTILTSGVLQKCAFIPPPALRTPGHDLTVLDEQSGGGAHAGPIAAFFLKTFLQCAVPPTPRQQTRSFVRETRAFVDAHPDLGGRAVRDTIIAAARAATEAPRLAIEEFARTHISAEDLRAQYLAALRTGGIAADVFTPELPEPRRQPRLVLEGDGVRVEIDPQRYFREIRPLNDDTLPAGTVLYAIENFGGARRLVLRATDLTEVEP